MKGNIWTVNCTMFQWKCILHEENLPLSSAGDIPHDDDSVLKYSGNWWNTFQWNIPPFRTLLHSIISNFAPRKETLIPWLRSPNQGQTKNKQTQTPEHFKRFVLDTKIKSYRVDRNLQNLHTFFRHRFRSLPLFLPHKRKANLCLMVNNSWQLLPFKLLQGQMTIYKRWITDHLDRRLCHVDPLWREVWF